MSDRGESRQPPFQTWDGLNEVPLEDKESWPSLPISLFVCLLRSSGPWLELQLNPKYLAGRALSGNGREPLSCCLIMQLPKAGIPTGYQTKAWPKMKKLNKMSTDGFRMLWHIPRALEGHMSVQGCSYDQGRPERALTSLFWLTLKPCTRKKERVRHTCKLP